MTDTVPVKTLQFPRNPRYNASIARYRKTPDGKFVVVGMALAEVDNDKRILRCSACHCVWDGQERFDGWLRRQVEPDVLIVIKDGGRKYREYRTQRKLELVEEEAT